MMLMPLDDVFVAGAPLTKQISASLTLPASGVYDWTEDWLTLAFDPGTKLDIASESFAATDMTFTASGASGWGGVTFASGSSGGLSDVVIERVGGSGYALDISNSSPLIDEVRIQLPANGTASGIRVHGSGTPTISNTLISGMHGDGIVLAKPSQATLLSNTVTGSGGGTRDGLVAGLYADASLGRASGALRGNQFVGNGTGVYATFQADLTFSQSFGSDGFNSMTDNAYDGIYASAAATIDAGNSFSAQRNRFLRNAGSHVTGKGSGTAIYALCDWWGTPAPPFDTGVGDGAVLFNSEYLIEDPYVNPAAPCVSQSAKSGASGRDAFMAALAARGSDAPGPLAALLGVAGTHPDLAAASLMEVARIAARGDRLSGAAVQAEAALTARLATHGDDARRALLHVLHARGDLAGALALAESLAGSDDESDRVLGLGVRAYLTAEMGRDPLPALHALERAAPGSQESARVWEDLTGERPPRSAFAESPTLKSTPVDASGLAPVRPNPTTGAAHAPLSLQARAHVRAVVYDALGREVSRIHDGALDAGTHALGVAPAGWAPGVYLLSVHVTEEGGATARHLQRFTLAR